MTKRQRVLELVRIAAYNGDKVALCRLKVEGRISWEAFREAEALGLEQRRRHGIKAAI